MDQILQTRRSVNSTALFNLRGGSTLGFWGGGGGGVATPPKNFWGKIRKIYTMNKKNL